MIINFGTPDSVLTPSRDALRDILQAGIQAPSAENRHYIRFELAGGGVRLLSTDLPTWAEQPHRRTLALVSYGAVVENMALRAAALGHAFTTRWCPEPSRPELIAECRWSAATPARDPLDTAIAQRHTNRRFFRRDAVASESLQAMQDAAAVIPGASLLWMATATQRSVALRAIRLAETERFRRQALHHELFSAVRFELGWKQGCDEGLPPGALEVEPPMRAPFAALKHWPLMRALSRIGAHHMLGLRAAWLPCKLAPQIGLVVCDAKDESLAALALGRALQRAWLAATVTGLAFQPMAATLALTRQRAGGAWVSPAVQAQLRQCLDELLAGGARSTALFFRLGHADAPSVVTGRPPLGQFGVGALA